MELPESAKRNMRESADRLLFSTPFQKFLENEPPYFENMTDEENEKKWHKLNQACIDVVKVSPEEPFQITITAWGDSGNINMKAVHKLGDGNCVMYEAMFPVTEIREKGFRQTIVKMLSNMTDATVNKAVEYRAEL